MNWKSPVYRAMDVNGNWEDDPNGISEFYSWSVEMPSGHCIERSARFFGGVAFRLAIARWNRDAKGKYTFFYDAMDEGSHGLPDPNCEVVNEQAREDHNEAL